MKINKDEIIKKNITEFIEKFTKKNNKAPTYTDFEDEKEIPTIRTIQRKFGGLKAFGIDNRTGQVRSLKAKTSMDISDKLEDRFFTYLVKKFGRKNIHRESPYLDKGKIRSDFMVFYNKDDDSRFTIDIFFPADIKSFAGCVNIKLKKYNFSLLPHYVFLVNMNKKIKDFPNKKDNLPENVKIVSFHDMKKYIDTF